MSCTPLLASIVAGLPASTPFVGPEAIERRTGVHLAVRLGANESLFGPSPACAVAMREAVDEIQLYGDPEGYELRTALAGFHGITLDNIVLGSGIDELLGLFVRAYADPGETGIMSAGGYATMAYQLKGHDVRIASAPYVNDANDAPALLTLAQQERARILYLSTPDNPSGSWLRRDEVERLVAGLPPDCLLLLDEAYAEFGPPEDMLPLDLSDRRVVRLRTFSKAYGLAGLRVGYAFGAAETIRPIDRIRNQFGMGRLAQAGALAALADQDHVRSVVAAVAAGRARLTEIATRAGLEALPSATNFVLIDVGGADRARSLLTTLQDRYGIFIRMPSAAPLNRCIRVTVGPDRELDAFEAAFLQSLQTGF